MRHLMPGSWWNILFALHASQQLLKRSLLAEIQDILEDQGTPIKASSLSVKLGHMRKHGLINKKIVPSHSRIRLRGVTYSYALSVKGKQALTFYNPNTSIFSKYREIP